jgi:NADH-quinone oxidoreductase subunit M
MTLTLTVFVPLAGALVLFAIPRGQQPLARWVALAFSLAAFGLSVALALQFEAGRTGFQLGVTADWVRSLGVRFRLGVDGVSLPLVLLTTVLSPLAVVGSWRLRERARAYLALLLVLEAALIGVFVSLDLFLFYIFWEAVLVPSYFLVGVWGGPRRIAAAIKFFVYTLLGGLLMLVGIVGLAYLHAKATGSPSFDYEALRDLAKNPVTQRWLFLAFFAAFAIKTPLVPFHSWLPITYVEAPTATTVLLAGVMSKMGVYGFLRFALPLFPDAAHWFQPLLLSLAVIGILYCALVATGQRDFKRLVAYSSVSHLGFIVLGIFAFTVQGLQGGVFYMVAHGLVIGGLFFVTGMLQERRGTSDIAAFGGLQRVAPRMAGAMLVITLGAVALPGLIGFVGEFLTLIGAFLAHRAYAVLGALGVILGAVYLLWAYQRMWQGPVTAEENRAIGDLDGREWAIVVPLLAAIIALGIFPRPLLQRIEPAARQVAQITAQAAGQRPGSALGADRLDRSPTNPTVTARGAGPGPDGGARAPAGPAGPDR